MTPQERLLGFNQIANFVQNTPTLENVAKAQVLMDFLRDNPEGFWDALYDVLAEEPAYRAQAEALILKLGLDSALLTAPNTHAASEGSQAE
jgi:hypothetical protein